MPPSPMDPFSVLLSASLRIHTFISPPPPHSRPLSLLLLMAFCSFHLPEGTQQLTNLLKERNTLVPPVTLYVQEGRRPCVSMKPGRDRKGGLKHVKRRSLERTGRQPRAISKTCTLDEKMKSLASRVRTKAVKEILRITTLPSFPYLTFPVYSF
ncbi:hypothetical protein, unlikely [Trypanosoma brucei brucei TREU927]|uniref:Uncharacterized protein n=1 Tax=Trypanosoma brucei brucei (strain 927/4 GUTat10.1) TaxID=185431 RepID=Q38FI5_TRYB2|nr:hypothetical protein, unlikely [Trypanosoma brucei brucei TREU927]EAN76435.1 hypothetical protein, unlikely [Trypanosoma brucei brucei TREU927]